jgi:nitrous oxidase accessory protein NosD
MIRLYPRRAGAWLFGGIVAAGAVGCAGPANGEVGSAALAATAAACGTRHVSARRGHDEGPAGQPNDCLDGAAPCRTAQHAVDVACAGDEVALRRGVFRENVVINKPLTLAGRGRSTVLRPAVSNPNPCETGSLCGGAASNVVLVAAHHVTVRDLSVDGDNPDLKSGVVAGGVDVDARNGIITNNLLGSFDDLRVERVRVRNVFLRGIQVGNGGTFAFVGNRVRNVQGSDASVGIFNFGAAGLVEANVVVDANDGISSNHSRGTIMVGNRVRGSGSGLHADNAGDAAGSSPDVIAGNEVIDCTDDDGSGVWALLPYVAPGIYDNLVVGCAVGLGVFGQGAPAAPTFAGNVVDGWGDDASVGFFATNDQLGFGAGNAAASFVGNDLRQSGVGVYLAQQPGRALAVEAMCNVIRDNGVGVLVESGGAPLAGGSLRDNEIAESRGVGVDALAAGPFDASENFWGCAEGPGGEYCDEAVGDVTTDPFATAPPPCTGAVADRAGAAAQEALGDEGLFDDGFDDLDETGDDGADD